MKSWSPPAPLPGVRPDARRQFLGQFDLSRRITRRQRALLGDALRAGLVSPADLERLGIAVCSSHEWAGLDRPAEIRPNPSRRAWLAARGLRTQTLAVAELLAQESSLLVSHRAITLALRSKARSRLVPVLICRARAALPDVTIANAHGIGFRWVGDLPREDESC